MGSAAKLLRVDLEQIRRWITTGELKIVDGFATERARPELQVDHGPPGRQILLNESLAAAAANNGDAKLFIRQDNLFKPLGRLCINNCGDFRAPDLILDRKTIDIRAGIPNQPPLDNYRLLSGLRQMPGKVFPSSPLPMMTFLQFPHSW